MAKSIQPNRPEDLTALKAAYAQAQAAVAQEEANLVRAKANLQEAAENARRYRWLVAQGAVSAQEADARETQSKVAAADVRNMEERVKASRFSAEQSQQRLSMGLTGGRSEDIAIAKAQKLEIEATIKQLQSQIDQTVIKAPCDGIVMKRHVHLGEIALNNKTMFEIVRDGRLELKAQVPEKDLLYVKEGQPVEMTGDSGKIFKGCVREISPLVEQETRLGTVRIDIDSCPDLKPGNFLRGEILIGKENVATLPTSCVTYKGNRPLVYQVEESQGGSRARMLYVQLGARDGAFVQVLNGLKAGDMVVERGGGFLKDGDPVRVLTGNAQSQP
ncbi:MAG: Multidrug resistance protein MdtA precursor [bacterium ADurb.Bin425]|nr:MAG: Multidrug resistance protein MdtA precursor [bacterium ADurb.Bin425]